MTPMMMRFFTLVGIALAALSFQLRARAEPVADHDVRQQVQAVILEQLHAFEQDDADAAFATATPEVREQIGSALRFLALVRGNYPMVYRPAGIAFLAPETDEGQVRQLVSIRDSDQKTWIVLFSLERQPDRSWRIGSCIVAENGWTSI